MTRYRDRYQEIYQLLSRAELQAGSLGLEDLSLSPALFGHDNSRWLGFYTLEGLQIALEKYGFFRELDHLGYYDLELRILTDDPDEHLLRIFSTDPPVEPPLVEVVVRRDFLLPRSELAERINQTHIPVLTVDWLTLQHPLSQFTPRRPPLPGQRFPGLGVGAQVLELLRNVCHRLNLGGIATVPSHFHNALFYSEEFLHFDPHFQGAFLALTRDLIPQTHSSIAAASWALKWEMVQNKKDQNATFPWFQQLMLNPISPPLKNYFNAPDFRRDVRLSLQEHDFTVFTEPLQRALENRGIEPINQDRIQSWIHQI